MSIEQQTGCVAIVDGLFMGGVLAREMAERVPCVHIQSNPAFGPGFMRTVDPSIYRKMYVASTSNIDAIIDDLVKLQVTSVCAGSEPGVELADLIADRLGLQGNSAETSQVRRNKFLMSHAVEKAGEAIARQYVTPNLADALSWLDAEKIVRVAVKPTSSAGSDNIYICDDRAQVESAVTTILGSNTALGGTNVEVLLQEFIEGTEFVVNTVSRAGEIWTSDVWEVRKRLTDGGRKIYDFDELCNPTDPAPSEALRYVREILPALSLLNGPGHSEVIVTTNGARLLEVGARVSGAANPLAIRECTGSDQIALTIAFHTRPSDLDSVPKTYQRIKHSRCVHLITHQSGVFDHQKVREKLATLPTFSNIVFRSADGSRLRVTEDVATCPGAFFLVSEDPQAIERDYRSFRDWELDGFVS